MYKKLLLSIFTLLAFSPLQAYYLRGQVWHGKNKKNHPTTYILLGENHFAHNDKNRVAIQQMSDLMGWCKKLNAHVVVEDGLILDSESAKKDPFNYPNSSYDPALPLFFDLSKETSLRGFASLCYLAGIPATNFECRLSSLDMQTNGLFKHLMAMVKNISSFDDGADVNAIYQKELADFMALKENMPILFTFLETVNCPVQKLSHVLESEANNSPLEKELRTLSNYYRIKRNCSVLPQSSKPTFADFMLQACLLDSYLLHSAYSQDSSIVVICAGDAHIVRLAHMFEQLRFQKSSHLGDVPFQCIENPNDYAELDQININEFFINNFPNIPVEKNDWNRAELILSLRKKSDDLLLKNQNNYGKITARLVPLMLLNSASMGTGLLAGHLIGKDTLIQIAGKNIPLGAIIGSLVTGSSIYCGYKWLIAPQPLKIEKDKLEAGL